MITIDQSPYLQQLKDTVQKAVTHKESYFLSYIYRIDEPDLLNVFANGFNLGFRHRCYWTDGEDLSLVGIGVAFEGKTNGQNRFDDTQEKWKTISQRIIKNENIKGTGPLMLGGFSFTEHNQHETTWGNFPGAAFVVPRFLITNINGKTWMSINAVVKPDQEPDKLYEDISNELKQILSTDTAVPYYSHPIKLKEVVHEDKEDWMASVKNVTDRIKKGEVEKVVLSRTLNVKTEEKLYPEALLRQLLKRHKQGFVFAFEREGDCFIGATPERLVRRNGKLVYCDCLAGTASRGATTEDDKAFGNELLQDEKNLAEHRFVVEMIKKTMATFSNGVIAADHPRLVKAESVQHLYTPVSGWMKDGATLFQAIKQLHPTPAMGGTPREKALSIIDELEPHDRGWYASPIGWIDEEGNGDFAVGIRSCLIHDNTVRLFAGCGIVRDSDPLKEYEETEMKFRPILNALEA